MSWAPTINISKETLYQLYTIEHKSIKEISKILKVSYSTIRSRLIDNEIHIRKLNEFIEYSTPKIGIKSRGRKIVFSEEWKSNISKSKIKYADTHSKGITLKKSGYLEYTRGENYEKRVHVIIMEQHIGRKLLPNEIVHHINEIKTDNRIENLQLMTRSEHSRLHSINNHKLCKCYDISKESKKGELSLSSKLTEKDVIYILNSNKSQSELADTFNVTKSCIKHIKHRRSWKHLTI